MTARAHTLTGAYVLDAVDEDEREAVEQHLSECPECEREVRELEATVARLADTTVTEPPERMRDDVLARARRTRQESPRVDSPRAVLRPRPIPRWRRSIVTAAVALVLALAAGVATFTIMQRQLEQERARQDGVNAVLSAADAEVTEGKAEDGGQVTVVSSASRDQAVVLLALERIDDDRSYQVWKVDEKGPASGGVAAAGENSATMLVPGVNDADLIGITNEPSGGSDSPTLPMVADVNLDG